MYGSFHFMQGRWFALGLIAYIVAMGGLLASALLLLIK